jgi:tRNA dimethylallyltransferase
LNTVSKNKHTAFIPPVIIIFGPTAVGKTELLSTVFTNGYEVINADSMQVYRHLDIGTAKPEKAVLERLPHHLIDLKEPDEQYTAGEFVRRADQLIHEICARGNIPLVSGGTAFYLRTLLCGLPEAPPVENSVRQEVRHELHSKGSGVLYRELQREDPVAAAKISENDLYRLTRALEVIRTTGKPLSAFRVPQKIREDINPLIIGLSREREELYERINTRVDSMFANGLMDEVRTLIARGFTEEDPGLRGIGYREFFLMRAVGCMTLEDIQHLIKRNSRRFAKRQITFFRKIPGVEWISPAEVEKIRTLVSAFLQKAG